MRSQLYRCQIKINFQTQLLMLVGCIPSLQAMSDPSLLVITRGKAPKLEIKNALRYRLSLKHLVFMLFDGEKTRTE